MMNKLSPICSDAWLQRCLQSDEHNADHQAFVEHVDTCHACQSRLETLAAGENEWDLATTSLRDDGDESPNHARGGKSEAWILSMAQQLLETPSHPEMLGRIGRYDVERIVGSGGMGIVFKAFDTELNRPVAVKVLAPFLAGSGPARSRFAREARAAAAVVHEHVVAIHNVESKGPSPFLVMPLIVGESLQQRIDRQGHLELCELLRIAMQTALGLDAAHSQGLVHRDVKPSNILLEEGVERALLTDFGLARASDDASLTHTGYHPGTPQYMSPEQARGDSVDPRSDLFSLGSVIYTMCTGRPPFRAETSYGILRRITDDQPRPIREINPAIPLWLASIVEKLHAKAPENRFQSSEEVASLLKQCLAHVQHPTAVPLPGQCALPIKSYRKFWKILLFGISLTGLIAFGNSRFPRQEAQRRTPTANSPSTKQQPANPITVPSNVTTTLTSVGSSSDWTNENELSAFDRDLKQFEIDVSQTWPATSSPKKD